VLFEPDPLPALLLDRGGGDVVVDDRGALSAEPVRVTVTPARSAGVLGWAGPWAVDERWWDPDAAHSAARVQVVTDDGAARLLSLAYGRWWVEAAYD
jgi:protein ImuB